MTGAAEPEPPALAAATAMFVEILVVGIGALSAAVLLLIALIGSAATAKLAPAAGSSLVAGVALAAAYAVGILIDRAADTILASQRRRLRDQYFTSPGDYAQARLLLADHPILAARADYARSRMRICRGWILNTIALTLTADLAMLRYSFTYRPLTLCVLTLIGTVTAFGFHRAWYALTNTGYRKLTEQTAHFTDRTSPPPENVVSDVPSSTRPG